MNRWDISRVDFELEVAVRTTIHACANKVLDPLEFLNLAPYVHKADHLAALCD